MLRAELDTTKDLTYPRMMKSDTKLVLFRSPGKGTILDSYNEDEVGLYSEDFNMDLFEDFEGKLVLKNGE